MVPFFEWYNLCFKNIKKIYIYIPLSFFLKEIKSEIFLIINFHIKSIFCLFDKLTQIAAKYTKSLENGLK